MEKQPRNKRHISVLAICFSLILLFSCISTPIFVSADTAKTMPETLSDTKSPSSIVDDSCKGVVRVCSFYETYQGSSLSTGSGFCVGKSGEETDIIVTNRHVIVDLDTNEISENIYIMMENDAIKLSYDSSGEVQTLDVNTDLMIKCDVLWTSDEFPDVAILKAERKISDHVALPLMKTENAQRSDTVYGLGFPGDGDTYNMDIYGSSFLSCKVSDVIATDGTISRFTKLAYADNNDVIQHTASINHGNSGGPLITADGAIIGINTYSVGESGYSTSLYIDYAMDALDNEGIHYDVYDPEKKTIEESKGKLPIIPIACGAGVLLLVIIIVAIVAVSNKNNKIGSTNSQKVSGGQNSSNNSTSATGSANIPASVGSKSSIPPAANKPVILRLQGIEGVYAGNRFSIPDRMILGTSPTGASMLFPQGTPGISRTHCELINKNGTIYLRDLGSTYGTFLCGNPLPPNQAIKLQEGDVFYLSSTKQSFQIVRSKSS